MSTVVDRLNAALEGRYRIQRELGEGGMATVDLAEDVKPSRRVALKVLKPGQPIIADFGIALAVGSAGGARLTETGLSVGTPSPTTRAGTWGPTTSAS
jgi:hypothetical protein